MVVQILNEDCDSCDNNNCSSSACCLCADLEVKSKKLNNGSINYDNNSFHNFQQLPMSANNTKELIANCKEFRIDNNKCNLRIIGNDNRIRIAQNCGNLYIIGNNTRLKIINNAGHIKYTGNDGHICLGCESTQQVVDYIGCNGILKIKNSMNFGKSKKCIKDNNNTKSAYQKTLNTKENKCVYYNVKATSTCNAASAATTTSATPITTSSAKATKVKAKSASYGGNTKATHWQQFAEIFQQQNWQKYANISLPNLKEQNFHNNLKHMNGACKCKCKCTKDATENINIGKTVKVVNHDGNIVVRNSVNVTIYN